MALIKCPECGKEVSDKAEACIHCGYPLSKNMVVDIDPSLRCPVCKSQDWENDTNRNVFICKKCKYEHSYPKKQDTIHFERKQCPICKATRNVIKNGTLSCSVCGFVFEVVDKAENDKYLDDLYQNKTRGIQQNIPKCPMCGSTNISKISTMSRATSIIGFGILSKKIGKQWQCNNPKCKHLW